MRTNHEQERLLDDIYRSCFESSSLSDLGENILPQLENLLAATGSLIYRGNTNGGLLPIAGSLSHILPKYDHEYLGKDPIQIALQQKRPKLQQVSLLPEWKKYLNSSVYHDFAKPNHVEDFFHITLGDGSFNGTDMVAIMLTRAKSQGKYEEIHGLLLARLLPALEALVRRHSRMEFRFNTFSLMETMLEFQNPFCLALNLKGSLLWSSKRASNLLKLLGKGKNEIPGELVEIARNFHELFYHKSPKILPPATVVLSVPNSKPVKTEIRLSRTNSGEPFLIVEFDPALYSPTIDALAQESDLTPSEAKVLRLMALGMSNREISKFLFISFATVRTHVGRILSKLGVHSRVQAALLAHGLPVHDDEE